MGWDSLHADLGWTVLAVLLAVSFASSFITVAFGIGGGAVMLVALASLLPIAALIPVHGLVQLGSNVGRAALMLPHLHRGVVPAFVAGSLVGVAIGGLSVVQLSAGALQIGVGLFVLITTYTPPPAIMRRSASVAGGVSSFLTMFFGGTGPFVAAFVKAQGLDRMGHVATHASLMTIQHLLKTLVFGLLGFAFSQWAAFIALLIAAGFAGTWVGRHVLARIDEALFRRSLQILLTLLSLNLIWAGTAALLSGGGDSPP